MTFPDNLPAHERGASQSCRRLLLVGVVLGLFMFDGAWLRGGESSALARMADKGIFWNTREGACQISDIVWSI